MPRSVRKGPPRQSVVNIPFISPWYQATPDGVTESLVHREQELGRPLASRRAACIIDLPLDVLARAFQPVLAAGGHDARIVLQTTCKTFRIAVTLALNLWTDVASFPFAPTKFKYTLKTVFASSARLRVILDAQNVAEYPSVRDERIPRPALILGYVAHYASIVVEHHISLTKIIIELNRAGCLERLSNLVLAPAHTPVAPPTRIYAIDAPALAHLALYAVVATFPVSNRLTSLVLNMRAGFTSIQPMSWSGKVAHAWASTTLFDLLGRNALCLHRLSLVDVTVNIRGKPPQLYFPELEVLELAHSTATMITTYLQAFTQPESCRIVIRAGYGSPHVRFSGALIGELRALIDQRVLPFLVVGTFWNHSYIHFNPEARSIVDPRPQPTQVTTREEVSPVVYVPCGGSVDITVHWPNDRQLQKPIQWGELVDAIYAPRPLPTPIKDIEIAHEFDLGRPGHPIPLRDVTVLRFRPYDDLACFAYAICEMMTGVRQQEYDIYDLVCGLYMFFPSARTAIDATTGTIVHASDGLGLAFEMWQLFYRSPEDML